MPYKDPKQRQEYKNKWKRDRNKLLGKLPRGKHIRQPKTDEEKETAKQKRLIWEKIYRNKWATLKVTQRLLYAARSRAKKGNIECDIVESDIIVPTHCPILGIPLVPTRPRGDSRRDVASLDRIDPTKGYIKGNIEVISWLANTMKNNATPDLLIKFSTEMLRRYT